MLSHALRRPRALVLVLLTLALGLAMLAPAQSAPSRPSPSSTTVPFERSGNSGYSWWTSPTMARAPGAFYFTGVNSSGHQRVYRWTRTSMTHEDLGRTSPDDHNAPAISREPGKPTLVFYTGHPGWMEYRTAASDRPVLDRKNPAFGPARRMPFERRTTYVQVLRDGDRVVVLSRYLDSESSGWYYVTSPDSGATWSEPTELFHSEGQQAYLLMRAHDNDPSRVHVWAYWHPRTGPENRIGYRSLTFEQLFSGSAERFTLSGLDEVWRSDEAGPAEQSVRLLDGGDKNGELMTFIATWDDTARTPYYRVVTQRPDGRWATRGIRSAGATYGSGSGRYISGIALDDRPGVARIYYGYKLDAKRWRLQRSDLLPGGRLAGTKVMHTSTTPLARPVAVGNDLKFQHLDRYTSFKKYAMRVSTLSLSR